MKFDNKIIFMIVIIIGLYSVFLMLSDFEAISNQVLKFKIEYLPVILLVIPLGWIILFGRWLLLLQHAGVKVPFKECCKIYFAGFALGITPGKTGEERRDEKRPTCCLIWRFSKVTLGISDST